jgi:hypothetical protein
MSSNIIIRQIFHKKLGKKKLKMPTNFVHGRHDVGNDKKIEILICSNHPTSYIFQLFKIII